MPRCNLTLKQKAQLIELSKELSTGQLAKKFRVHTTTVTRTIRKRDRILQQASRVNPNFKTVQTNLRSEEHDSMMLEYIKNQQDANRPISVSDICDKAVEYAEALGREIKSQRAWWRRFRVRCNVIKSKVGREGEPKPKSTTTKKSAKRTNPQATATEADASTLVVTTPTKSELMETDEVLAGGTQQVEVDIRDVVDTLKNIVKESLEPTSNGSRIIVMLPEHSEATTTSTPMDIDTAQSAESETEANGLTADGDSGLSDGGDNAGQTTEGATEKCKEAGGGVGEEGAGNKDLMGAAGGKGKTRGASVIKKTPAARPKNGGAKRGAGGAKRPSPKKTKNTSKSISKKKTTRTAKPNNTNNKTTKKSIDNLPVINDKNFTFKIKEPAAAATASAIAAKSATASAGAANKSSESAPPPPQPAQPPMQPEDT